jgi:hypothetical protein
MRYNDPALLHWRHRWLFAREILHALLHPSMGKQERAGKSAVFSLVGVNFLATIFVMAAGAAGTHALL